LKNALTWPTDPAWGSDGVRQRLALARDPAHGARLEQVLRFLRAATLDQPSRQQRLEQVRYERRILGRPDPIASIQRVWPGGRAAQIAAQQ